MTAMTGLSKLGKYAIRRELGKGAMGVVYEGFDPVIERTVAIKTILPQQLGGQEGETVLARFKREAQAAGRLNHPGIVAVYEYGEDLAVTAAEEDDDRTVITGGGVTPQSTQRIAYIAMEFVKGRELREFFETNERFALHDVERLMGEILDALGHAHASGVVHRDIKPANLIVLDSGKVKVADFGIARIEKSELTQVGTVMGTPAYMSPEQFMGQAVDGRSDIFSCGVILYQFLTGEKPFTGNATTIMFKVLHEEPLAPSMLNTTLPAAFDAVVKKAMAKKPEERYQSAQEFAQAITGILNAPASPPATAPADPDSTVLNTATATDTTAATAVTTATVVAAPAPAPAPIPEPRPPSRAALAVAALAGIAILGSGAAYFLRGTQSAAPQTSAAAPTPSVPATPAPPPTATAVANELTLEPGTMVISALGLVNPQDARFNGDAAAAQAESRADARRHLMEKAVALYVDQDSLNKNYALLDRKLLSQSGAFIKTVIQEGSSTTGKDGLISTEARAVVRVRAVQKSLNQLSKEERIEFIRNNGDPKVSILMAIRNADTAQPLPPERSMLAENVVKERIKSFGFRVWSVDGETGANANNAQTSDFQIEGEVRVKLLSAKLPASGLTISKTALTSWTLKAIDKASGEEVYLNTVTPQGKSWATEDQALAEIGKLVGDAFSKSFFLEHFNFSAQKVDLTIVGLPDAQSAALLLRELRGFRQVLDAQLVAGSGDSGKYQLQLAEGNPSDLIGEALLKPLNHKLGLNCFSLAGAAGSEVRVNFSSTCAEAAVRGKLSNLPPAGRSGGGPSV
jgi:serine/threonine protein kinase